MQPPINICFGFGRNPREENTSTHQDRGASIKKAKNSSDLRKSAEKEKRGGKSEKKHKEKDEPRNEARTGHGHRDHRLTRLELCHSTIFYAHATFACPICRI